jgi:multicomponent Na+:H+ antiporter subunit A
VQFDPRLSEFFAANARTIAHGSNIVNVILVDFRALDTLGEIAVVMVAGLTVLALLRVRGPWAKREEDKKAEEVKKAAALQEAGQ